MLEPSTYRRNERLAREQLTTWRTAAAHSLEHFEKIGFPVRIDSIAEVGQLLDTMQEGRWDAYMAELGGLTDTERELFVAVCCDVLLFQMIYLPARGPAVPLTTLLSSFVLYRKCIGVDADFRSVLEIGPGCGYLSFFLRGHGPLRNYSQIEACESFYILQNLVNVHCFGHRFDERAHLWTPRPGVCSHYPWWRLKEFQAFGPRFQIITSNANLLEFSVAALDEYLALAHKLLLPSGVFIVQCPGAPSNGVDAAGMDAKLAANGFQVLSQGQPPEFAVANFLFVRTDYPMRKDYCPDTLVKMLHARPPGRRPYSMAEILASVTSKMKVATVSSRADHC